jgi:hypothetical protein
MQLGKIKLPIQIFFKNLMLMKSLIELYSSLEFQRLLFFLFSMKGIQSYFCQEENAEPAETDQGFGSNDRHDDSFNVRSDGDSEVYAGVYSEDKVYVTDERDFDGESNERNDDNDPAQEDIPGPPDDLQEDQWDDDNDTGYILERISVAEFLELEEVRSMGCCD